MVKDVFMGDLYLMIDHWQALFTELTPALQDSLCTNGPGHEGNCADLQGARYDSRSNSTDNNAADSTVNCTAKEYKLWYSVQYKYFTYVLAEIKVMTHTRTGHPSRFETHFSHPHGKEFEDSKPSLRTSIGYLKYWSVFCDAVAKTR